MNLKSFIKCFIVITAILVIVYLTLNNGNIIDRSKNTIKTVVGFIQSEFYKNQLNINNSNIKISKYYSITLKNQYLNIVNSTVIKHNFVKATLRSAGRSLIIFVHYSGDLISNNLISKSTWEPHLVIQFEQYIKSHPGIQMLDIGCNLGVYTLTAAALGCTVVAVDANRNNTARVVQSLIANGIQHKTTVLLNAMSNVRKYFVIGLVPQNIGGSNVFETENDINRVKAIFLDDLIPFFNKSKQIAIKIDIEGKEIDALKKAANFFAEHQVTLVMMEWEHIKKLKDIKFVIDFFTSRSFKSFTNIQKNQPLSLESYISWPYDIFWMK